MMGIFDRLLGRRDSPTPITGAQLLEIYGGDNPNKITERTSCQQVAVYACVRVLSETIASLPLILYKRTDTGKQRAIDHSLYPIIHDSPNSKMTSFTWRETMIAHLLLWGNCYNEIDATPGGDIKAIWPLEPDKVEVRRVGEKGRDLAYKYTGIKGQTAPIPYCLHIPGLGFNGQIGFSPVQMMKQALGLGAATEKYGTKYFTNGARPGGVLQTDGKLTPPVIERLRESWRQQHEGAENSHKLTILEEGLKYQSISLPPEDSQFLETRAFQTTEIARMFRVPPHLIADLSKATFSNIEHQSIEYVTHTIRPWCVRIEQAINSALLSESDRKQGYFVEFLLDGLLRGDIQARYNAYKTGINNGFLSANDVRRMENMDELPPEVGDLYLVPANVMPAEMSKQFWEGKEVDAIGQEGNIDAGTGTGNQGSDGSGTGDD